MPHRVMKNSRHLSSGRAQSRLTGDFHLFSPNRRGRSNGARRFGSERSGRAAYSSRLVVDPDQFAAATGWRGFIA